MLLSKWKHILHFLKILSTADLAIISGDDTAISTETSSKKAKTYKRLASVPPGVCPGSEGVLYRDHRGLASHSRFIFQYFESKAVNAFKSGMSYRHAH
ncbi:hypothetical protein [Zymobacter palmae]|uniref:hypothetical protein n=1 Tax=Zymobacter palmae TaxID=33074 RepID=UPI0011AE9541|nr:hypothetical protein [Zymobacter palmae]